MRHTTALKTWVMVPGTPREEIQGMLIVYNDDQDLMINAAAVVELGPGWRLMSPADVLALQQYLIEVRNTTCVR